MLSTVVYEKNYYENDMWIYISGLDKYIGMVVRINILTNEEPLSFIIAVGKRKVYYALAGVCNAADAFRVLSRKGY